MAAPPSAMPGLKTGGVEPDTLAHLFHFLKVTSPMCI